MNAPYALWRLCSAMALLAVLFCVAPASAADPPKWEPMLAKSFKGDAKNLGVASLAVYRNPGCVFLLVEGKVYCSSAGAADFKLVTETWKEVCEHAQKKRDSKHRLIVTDDGIKESTDGGATWSKPISLPKDFANSADTWVEYDATNDVLYVMNKSSDLFKLKRSK